MHAVQTIFRTLFAALFLLFISYSRSVFAESQTLMDMISARAQSLSKQEYRPYQGALPKALQEIDYEQYRSIRFKSEKAIWRNQKLFEIQLFHPGFLFKETVDLYLVKPDGYNAKVDFDPSFFLYEGKAESIADQIPKDFGYAGFRLHYPLNDANYKDEVMVFQGASYFRLVAPGQVYGISARGLAVNTAEPGGEEFPRFTEFWLVEPKPDDTHIVLYALLDSPSVSGSFRFELTPEINTQVNIESRLYPRTSIQKLGVAPLTSMFFYGENQTEHKDDFRPEVHDSDGLLMHTAANEWVWRPLKNPKTLQVIGLQDVNPKGFGLLQRDRHFNNYLDNEARYHQRPSFWVTPLNQWGKGRVELVEIPTSTETNDNIVSYWVPNEPIEPGREYRFNYQLSSIDGDPQQHLSAKVMRTRIGWAAMLGQPNPPPKSKRQFIVDFQGDNLAHIAKQADVQANITLSSGKKSELTVTRLPGPDQMRVSFKLDPEQGQPVDMRLFLSLHGKPISEVWNYVWLPQNIN